MGGLSFFGKMCCHTLNEREGLAITFSQIQVYMVHCGCVVLMCCALVFG